MPASSLIPDSAARVAKTATVHPVEGAATSVLPQPLCEGVHADAERRATLEAQLVPAPVASALAETFRVLGDPTRVRILDLLSRGEHCVCDIASLLGSSESAVSHQLRLLRGMRLVRTRRSGRQIFYALDDHHISELFSLGRAHVLEQVTQSLVRHN